MYVKKSVVEYWVNNIMKHLQNTKEENDTEQLKHTYTFSHGKLSMLYLLDLITDEQWKKLHEQILKIVYE